MEQYNLEQDINVLCVAATSFPEGVMAAHQKIHAVAPPINGRRYFGLSRPEGGNGIVYKAAAEAMYNGEAAATGCEPFIIKKGLYVYKDILNFMDNLPSVGATFMELLQDPRIDQNGMCVEWYMGEKDMRCMVRLDDSKA